MSSVQTEHNKKSTPVERWYLGEEIEEDKCCSGLAKTLSFFQLMSVILQCVIRNLTGYYRKDLPSTPLCC